MSPSTHANPKSDVTSAASFGGSDSDSYYVDSAKNSPTSSANTPDLKGHIIKMETMREVLEGKIDTSLRPTALFSYTNELKILEIADTETDPPENLQENGAMPPVSTYPSLSYSSLKDTLVTLAKPTPRHRVEAGDATLQARAGDLPDVRLLGANHMLYGVLQDWVNQNLGENFYGGVVEDSELQAR